MHEEKNKKKRASVAVFDKNNLCVREQRKIREIFFFFGCEACTRIIIIDLIIVKLLGVCFVVFPFKEKGFFM